jgi:hypothetical protein
VTQLAGQGGPLNLGTHQKFVDVLRPMSAALELLAGAGYGANTSDLAAHRPATADSPATGEIARQGALAGVWDQHPIDTAITHIGLAMLAARDAVCSFAATIVADHTPLYAYQPVARFGIEASGMAFWLAEPGIGDRERVRRSLNNRLLSDYEQSKLPDEVGHDPEVRARLLAATQLGFKQTTAKGRVPHLDARPPTITKLVRDVLGDDQFGATMYSYLSAVSHATIWGLINVAQPDRSSTAPVHTTRLVHKPTRIVSTGVALALAYQAANRRVVNYFGWSTERWDAAKAQAFQRLAQYLPTRTPT